MSESGPLRLLFSLGDFGRWQRKCGVNSMCERRTNPAPANIFQPLFDAGTEQPIEQLLGILPSFAVDVNLDCRHAIGPSDLERRARLRFVCY